MMCSVAVEKRGRGAAAHRVAMMLGAVAAVVAGSLLGFSACAPGPNAGEVGTIQLPRSLGAAAQRVPVRGGGFLREGSRVTNVEKITSGRGIREVGRLVETYGGRAQNWRKLKGIGEVETPSGALRRAELHWYEGHGVGRVEFKVKQWLE